MKNYLIASITQRLHRIPIALVPVYCVLFVMFSGQAMAAKIGYSSFSNLDAIGPPVDRFSDHLNDMSTTLLGDDENIEFYPLPSDASGTADFDNIVSAVEAGTEGGGIDAAYVPALSINSTWGFIYTSGIPFGPNFEEFMGFLYGPSVDQGTRSGIDLFNEIIQSSGKNIVVLPVVGGSEQGSGYFMKPIGKVVSRQCEENPNAKRCFQSRKRGIGLKGLCQEHWKIRYIPIARDVLNVACDNLVDSNQIREKNISFIQPTPGAGVYESMVAGDIQAFEVSTPLDDVSGLFAVSDINPGTVGARYLHFPGWHQPFLITYMMINKDVWDSLSVKQQRLLTQVSRESVTRSYSESLAQQGPKLKEILQYNDDTPSRKDDIRLSVWKEKDLRLLEQASNEYLTSLAIDSSLTEQDRNDYVRIIHALQAYIEENALYWKIR